MGSGQQASTYFTSYNKLKNKPNPSNNFIYINYGVLHISTHYSMRCHPQLASCNINKKES